jgi:cytochrome c-type biogenesis protein CcmE
VAEINWEKTGAQSGNRLLAIANGNRFKFGVVSVVLIGVVAFLLISGTASSGRYFIPVSTLLGRHDLQGQTVKVTGAVIGSSIHNDPTTHTYTFTVANLNDDADALQKAGGLANALHLAVNDTTAQHLQVVVLNQALPDLLQNEAQAIISGQLDADGIFHADEVLLKCPSRYQSDLPKQSAS